VPAVPIERTRSLSDRAYLAIRGLIVSLELSPGAPISEPELIERLGIGRTPVREALQRLAREELVAVYPRRGMFVTGVDVRDLVKLSEVRAAIEPEAARLAAERATDADRAEIDGLLAELRSAGGDERALIDLDERIHRVIYRAAHNDLMEATLEQYYVLALRIWYLALDRAHELRDAVQEHSAVLEAIRDGDGAAAAQVMRTHIEEFEQTMRGVLIQP
jgi:DNA-binding GntR family transcriptional regulator